MRRRLWCLGRAERRFGASRAADRDEGRALALTRRQRSRFYLVCSSLAVVFFHVAFLLIGTGRHPLPLMTGFGLAVIAGGYAWPPIGNPGAVKEAARGLGWSKEKVRRVSFAINVLSWGLFVSMVLGVVLATT